jgi:hypothetical protein
MPHTVAEIQWLTKPITNGLSSFICLVHQNTTLSFTLWSDRPIDIKAQSPLWSSHVTLLSLLSASSQARSDGPIYTGHEHSEVYMGN